jgi:hypothetical protein
MSGFDVKKLREAEEAMAQLKQQSAKLREVAATEPGPQAEELVRAANQLEEAADALLKTIHEYRLTIH